MTVRILPLGGRALLVEFSSLARVRAFDASLRTAPIDGVTQVVPAARTVALHVDPARVDAAELARQIRERTRETAALAEADAAEAGAAGAPVDISVRYDGPDLDRVAQDLGMTREEVVGLHSAGEYIVAFNGFSPGFPYLAGLPKELHRPRLTSPRARVPRGSVAIAGEFCGIYPTASPGGWRLIGRTEAQLWDANRAVPPLLPRGTRVRFVPLDGAGRPGERADQRVEIDRTDLDKLDQRERRAVLAVDDPGPLTVIEDGGRIGRLAWAVSPAGAADATSLHTANRLAGNLPESAALETMGGLVLTALQRTVVAVAGAPARATVNQGTLDASRPILLLPGDSLTLDIPRSGVRTYLAVRGGVAAAESLGSASFDALSGLGPPPLRVGDTVAVAVDEPGFAVAIGGGSGPPLPGPGDVVTLRISAGPRAPWFTQAAHELLARQEWEVTPESDRIGVRLHADTPLARAVGYTDAELPSEGLVAGAIQVPPSGEPLLFGSNHPTTGGYPVIACVDTADLPRIGQLPAGARVRFEPSATSFVPPGA